MDLPPLVRWILEEDFPSPKVLLMKIEILIYSFFFSFLPSEEKHFKSKTPF